MKTSFLNDKQIHPIEYRKWADAVRHFERHDKDRKKVDELKRSISERGLQKPIILGVSDRYPDVYVGDGHHRAVALMELGIESFAFHWYWIKNFGVRMEHEPFPYRLLGL
ncbi:ParB/RepB/Spo0J family partition protein [Streptomyces netropsis]|uniref:ParB-like chromosome segregation protein Spo0J n=1 Tax=Streptomyces netropsis TaxID=55404 RepID=A0A7W7PHI7_STRNE|nr:ParB/RepB/Spo0J family partition protein [Streptomyces netropsis]MBB4889308.1 ParB-like chromosome segregation protein Spo0J [Streptomyces netropsis]